MTKLVGILKDPLNMFVTCRMVKTVFKQRPWPHTVTKKFFIGKQPISFKYKST